MTGTFQTHDNYPNGLLQPTRERKKKKTKNGEMKQQEDPPSQKLQPFNFLPFLQTEKRTKKENVHICHFG